LEHVVRALRPLGAEFHLATEPAGGPLGALLAVAPHVRAPWLFAAPGDAPLIDAAFVLRLWQARCDGDEAVVPRAAGPRGVALRHPLPAFYAREALLREAPAVIAGGRRSLLALLERLRVREVEVSAGEPALINVNTPEDLARISKTPPP
jgi:molybdopterin-guanine dinucleotide biosynthesis protein A